MEWVTLTAYLGVTAGDDNDPGVDCGEFSDGECEHGDALFTEANAMNRDCQLSGLTSSRGLLWQYSTSEVV